MSQPTKEFVIKVLIANGNVDERMFLKKVLESEGYHVEVATHGEEAIDMVKAASPDMIIADIPFPKIDGLRLCKLIKSDPKLRNIPFIFYVSKSSGTKNKQLAIGTGAAKYLVKPIQTAEFLKIVNELIHKVDSDALTVTGKQDEVVDQIEKTNENTERLSLYRNVFINSKDAIVLVDHQGVFIEHNPAHRALLQYSNEEYREKKLEIHGEGKSFSEISKQIAVKGFFRENLIRQTKSGKKIVVELTVFPIKEDNGKPTCYAYIYHDIRQGKEMENRLRQKQKLDTIGQLAGGVAHEFNNLLTPIIGYVDILLEQRSKLPKDRDILLRIQQAAHHASVLTRKLLSFSRRAPTVLKPRFMTNLAAEVDQRLHKTIDPGIKLTVQSSEDLWPALIDTDQIHQVILNLCTNSQDSLKECMLENPNFQAWIKINIKNVRLDQVSLKSHPEAKIGDFIRLSVADNGKGIDENTLPHLFEPFFTTRGLSQRAGLGLASSHGIVEKHKGWIEVKTLEGTGTNVEVYLPRSRTSVPAQVQEAQNQPKPCDPSTIMIIDDDELVRSLGDVILRGLGYRVLLAGDGDQALEIFKHARGHIALVILDLTMPRQSGWEVLRKLRLLDPTLKAIISTGHTLSDHAKEAKELQPFTLLSKPFKPSEMKNMVQTALKKGNPTKGSLAASQARPIRTSIDRSPQTNPDKYKERRSGFNYIDANDRRCSNNPKFKGRERRTGMERRHIEKYRASERQP